MAYDGQPLWANGVWANIWRDGMWGSQLKRLAPLFGVPNLRAAVGADPDVRPAIEGNADLKGSTG